jgi:hypothetical protein
MQLGGGAKLLDALFVMHDTSTGAWASVDLASGGAGGTLRPWSTSASTSAGGERSPSALSPSTVAVFRGR